MNPIEIEKLKNYYQNSIVAHLGIEFLSLEPDFLIAKMPVDQRTIQPRGVLHGGASVVLAETLGSVGSFLSVDPDNFFVLGTEVSASHLKAVATGFVIGKASLKKKGKTTHLWHIEIFDEKEDLVCLSRLSVRILEKRL